MVRSDLIARLIQSRPDLAPELIEQAVKYLINGMAEALCTGERIEIRGFGSFQIKLREPRIARNPKTGQKLLIGGKAVSHFKPGKELRERVNASA